MLRITILRLLADGPMHGYEIMKRIEQDTDGRWVPSHSLLYNTLGRLRDQGLLSDQPDLKGKVERTVYKITDRGKNHLDEALTQMAQMISNMLSSIHDKPIPRLPRLLMDQLPPEEVHDLLIKMRNKFEEVIESIDEELQAVEGRLKKSGG